jgi:uncharacterized protein (DUF4415 family)
VIAFVVHTDFEEDGEEAIRLISARRATSRERKSCEEAQQGTAARHRGIGRKKDADIDLSEMPEILDWTGAEIGRFYRAKKRPITIRLDEDVLAWLKGYGSG